MNATITFNSLPLRELFAPRGTFADPFELTLIGWTADAPHARMGLRRAEPYGPSDFEAHHQRVHGTLCILDGCENKLATAAPQAWCCDLHDPLGFHRDYSKKPAAPGWSPDRMGPLDPTYTYVRVELSVT